MEQYLTKRKYQEGCYYCGEPACTDEHVPPQMMFDGSCDSITVPSCKKHNTVKGASDQAIINSFLLTLSGAVERYSFKSEVLDSIVKKKPSFERTKYKAFNTPLLKEQKDLPNVGYITSDADMKGWVRHITAALVWDGIRYFEHEIDWSKVIVWSPNIFESTDSKPFEIEEFAPIFLKKIVIQSKFEKLPWEDGWSAYPRPYPVNIFSFQICFLPHRIIMFRFRFYLSFVCYAAFTATKKAKGKLAMKVHKPS